MYKMEEKKLIFDDDTIFRVLHPLDFGSTCDIYKLRIYGQLYAVKVFNGLQRVTLEGCLEKQAIDIPSYITPLKILYINGKFKGYAMKFCEGRNLAFRKLDLSIEEFAKSTVKLMEDTEKLSELKFQLFDSYITNGMYDNGFKMIDTDDYYYLPNESLTIIQNENRKNLNLFLKDVFVKNTGLYNISDDELKNVIEKCDKGEILFDEVFNIFCTKAYNITDIELNNISDIGKVLSKSKKR